MKITKRLEWNEEKNQQLQQDRDLSFEAIQLAIEERITESLFRR